MLAEIRNKVASLFSDWTTTKAGYVDTSISSRSSQTSVDTLLTRVPSTVASSSALQTVDNEIAVIDGNVDTLLTRVPAGYIDAPISTAGLPVPTSIKSPTVDQAMDVLSLADATIAKKGLLLATANTGALNSWQTILQDASGSGVIQFISVGLNSATNTQDNLQCRLVIDGTEVWISDTAQTLTGWGGFQVIGAWSTSDDLASFDQVRYTSGFSVQVRNIENSTVNAMKCVYKYYETS